MKLEYDAGKLAALSEQELKALHKELAQVERDAHKAARLAWEELTRRRSARISEQTKEKRRQARHRTKIRELEGRREDKFFKDDPQYRELIEFQIASEKAREAVRLRKRGRTITADRELRQVKERDK